MAHACILRQLHRQGKVSFKQFHDFVVIDKGSRRQLKTSALSLCSSSARDPQKIGMHAAPPTTSVQHSQAVQVQGQYEPTLIANPSPSTKVTPDNTHIIHSITTADTVIPELSANTQELQFSKSDLSNIVVNQVDPRSINRVYYFDSLALSKRLEARGFTRDQAEGCVECLLEIIGNTLEHQAKHMITKSEQKIAEQQLHSEITSVKKDMVLLQKSEFSALRTETEKISIDIARIQSHFQDEVVKLKGQFTLDVNLERGRAVEAHAVSEKNLQMLNNKIETEIAHLKTTYEIYRNDIFKYAAGTVLTCTTLIIGFIRLWK